MLRMENKQTQRVNTCARAHRANNVIDKVKVYFGGVDVDGGACDVTEAAPESILERAASSLCHPVHRSATLLRSSNNFICAHTRAHKFFPRLMKDIVLHYR